MIEENLGKCLDLSVSVSGGLLEVLTEGVINKVLIAALVLSVATPLFIIFRKRIGSRKSSGGVPTDA